MIGMLLALILRGQTFDLSRHLAVMVTILGTVMLGFADDMLDLPWRYKLLFPFFIIMPMVAVYSGPTHITVVYPFSVIFGWRI
jgi:UDP-N-acetylglucosamine--dolichyl-phosphate N-acetylglucosaminephosphotransferase